MFAVPQRVSKHPAKSLDTGKTPLLISMDDYLGIGIGAKHVTGLKQFLFERLEIIDLTIEHEPYRFVLVGHRLVASGRKIDD